MDFNDSEKEILALKAVWSSIASMLNYEVLSLNHHDPDSSIQFTTRTHQQYFNLILLDFLHADIYGVGKNCLDALNIIIDKPLYCQDATPLKYAFESFKVWLEQEVEFEHNGETRKLWFPSINKEIALKITRSEFIQICGNISKHNPLGLSKQAQKIKNIFAKNNLTIDLTEALLIMGEFYEQFHDDLFNYHSSTIAEFLNNLRWAIYEYLQPLYRKSVEWYPNEIQGTNVYRYKYPENINNLYVKEIFWSLMNEVRLEPYMPKFVVTRYLKLRY